MKKLFQYWFGKYGFGLILIVGVIYLIFFRHSCSPPKVTETRDTVIQKNEFTGQTIQSGKGKDSLIYRTETIRQTDTFWKDVDTTEILRQWNERKIYENTYTDSHLVETIIDTVQYNRITGRARYFTVTCFDTVITVERTIQKSANGLYGGLQTDLKDVAPSLLYIRGKSAYGLSYELKNKNIKFSYYLLLGK